MKKNVLALLFAFIVAAILGCAASVGVGTGYHPVLDTIPPDSAPIPMAQGARPSVAIGPVGVPGYILRAAIVSQEFEWNPANVSAADLDDAVLAGEIPRVITVNMERLLTPRGLAVIPGGPGTATDYRISVDLSAFDLTQFNTLETKGQWALYQRGNPAPLLLRDIDFSTAVAGSNTGAVRAAMSRSLADLTASIVRDFEAFLGTR